MNPWTRIAGYAGLAPVIHDFYERVLLEPTLAPYFAGVDTAALVDHQVKFVGTVVGGPDNYKGRSIRDAHRGLAIDREAFEAVAGLLRDTLEDHGWPEAEIEDLLAAVASLVDDVVEESPDNFSAVEESP